MALEWWLSGRRLRQAIGSFSLATIAYMEFRSALFRLNSVQPVTVVGAWELRVMVRKPEALSRSRRLDASNAEEKKREK